MICFQVSNALANGTLVLSSDGLPATTKRLHQNAGKINLSVKIILLTDEFEQMVFLDEYSDQYVFLILPPALKLSIKLQHTTESNG
jgi:hypothetical protein